MKRRLAALLCALALSLSLAGCWSSDVRDEGNAFWEEPPEQEADNSPLTPITSFALPYLQGVTLDPLTCPDGIQQVLGALLYEGLFALDESFAPQNVLCSRYERSDDGTSYTFYLRDDASFSDGSALTANDALATLRRAQQSERYSARVANVSSMRASGGTLIITLSRADSAFPALLDIPIVKAGSEKSTVPLGTGPYLFVTDGDGAFLKRSADWHGGALPFARIELRAAKDTDTAAYLFSSREVHLLLSDLTSGTGDLRSAEIQSTDYATANMIYLGFNTQRTLLSDAALRSAYFMVTGHNPDPDAFTAVRGMDGWKEAAFDIPGAGRVRVAVVSGLGNTRKLMNALRSGKARKNDPPIPADLAPISGSGKRVRREQTEEKPVLEPIRFRYSTEKIVDDPEEEKPEAAESPEPKAPRSRNRRRKPRPQTQDAAPEQAKPAPQEAAAKPEASGDRPRRRPNHRRRKPRPAGDGQ